MSINRNLTVLTKGFTFKKVSASLTLLPLVASNFSLAAYAGEKNEALQQFMLNNPDMGRKEVKQAFREFWQDNRNNDAVVNNAVNAALNNGASSTPGRPQVSDFSSKAEFQAAKHAFQLQQKALNDTNFKTVQQVDSGKYINVKGGFNLDLTSAVESITLGDALFKAQESVKISVGGQEKTLSAGSKVTAAEYVAAKQALSGAQQSVTLDASGRATGGVVDLDAMTNGNKTMKVNDLVVPVDVIAAGDFSKGGDVRIKGDLTNSGSINAFASGNNAVNAIISADNIINNSGASITSAASDLTLQAERNFSNYGNISATGNLTLSAGKSLANAGSVSADGNLNVLSPKVFNVGILASTGANVNLDTPITQEMRISNYGGTISALNGAINVRNADYAAKFDSLIVGGDLRSKELNAFTGQGTTDIYVNDLTGVVNVDGNAAHVSANTSNLILGNQCLVDDPTYYNTGNIILSGDIIVGESLAIIAGGNITTDQDSLTIRARATSGNLDGQDIQIIAGANVTGTGAQTPGNLPAQPPLSGNISTGTSASFSGASATGGDIDLSNVSSASIIDTRPDSGSAAGKGGRITLAAFKANGSGGQIKLNENWDVNASGNNGGNGAITIIGADTIEVGSVTNNGAGTAADISIFNAQPVLSSGQQMVFGSNGTVQSNNRLVPSNIINNSSVSTGVVTSSGNVTIRSGDTLNVGNIQAGFSAGVNLFSKSTMTVSAVDFEGQGDTGTGTFLATSWGYINFTDSIRANGGIVAVASLGLSADGNDVRLYSEKSGNAGNITLVAGAEFSEGPNGITIIGQSVTGGSIYFDNSATEKVTQLSADSAADGDGGTVNLVAYNGIIHLNKNLDVSASSNGSTPFNDDGTINIIAGSNTSDAIVMGGALTNGGLGGAVNVMSATPNAGLVISTGSDFGATSSSFLSNNVTADGGVSINRPISMQGGDITIRSGAGGAQFGHVSSFGNFEVTSLGNIVQITTPEGGNDPSILGAADRPNTLLWTALGNISFSGNIDLHSPVGTNLQATTGGGYITMVAGGTVQSIRNPNGFTLAALDASSDFDGGDITVIAGADFSRNGSLITVNGASGTGGSILFSGSTRVDGWTAQVIIDIDTHSQGSQLQYIDAGDITLVSFGNLRVAPSGNFSAAAGVYSVPMPDVVGSNGNVTIVAPGLIQLSQITFNQDAVGGGQLIQASTPSATTIGVDGKFIAGNFQEGALVNTDLSFFGQTFAGTNFTLRTLGNVSADGFDVGTTEDGINAGTVNITAANVNVLGIMGDHGGNGDGNAATVSIKASTITLGNVSLSRAGAGDGNAGTIVLDADTMVIGNINAGKSSNGVGDGGTIRLSTNSSTVFGVNTGLAGSNTGTLNVSTAFTGNGGTIEIENEGIGGVTIGNVLGTSVNNGDGAHISFSAASGNLDIQAYTTGISVNGTGTDSNGGSVSLIYNSLTANAFNPINLTANGTGNGVGGDIYIQNTSAVGTINFGAGSGEFNQVQATDLNDNGGSITVKSGYIINLGAGSAVSAHDLSFESGLLIDIDQAPGSFGSQTYKTGTFRAHDDIGGYQLKTLDITAQIVEFEQMYAQRINIQSPTGLGLTVTGNGNLGALDGSDPIGQIYITAAADVLTLQGGIQFLGNAYLLAAGVGQQIVNNGVMTAYAQSYAISGGFAGGTYASNPPSPPNPNLWVFTNPGSFANGTGDITLTGPLNFAGSNFAIIASGNINLTGATIDLTGSGNANGGSLTLFAGVEFDPFTNGQQFIGGPFTNFTATGSGSILGGANIITSGGAGGGNTDGGRVIAVANNGTITLGNITTHGNGAGGVGGNVMLIATGGITVGDIDTVGPSSGGNVTLRLGTADFSGVANITNGTLNGSVGGTPTTTSGNILVNAIYTYNGVIDITGAKTATDSITVTTSASTNNFLSLHTGVGSTDINGSVQTLSGNGGGTVRLNNAGRPILNLGAVSNWDLTVTNDSDIFVNQGTYRSINLTATNGGDITLSNGIGPNVSTSATLTTQGGGDILGALFNASSITLNASGNIGTSVSDRFITTAATNVSANASGDVFFFNLGTSDLTLNASSSGAGKIFAFITSGSIIPAGVVTSDQVNIAAGGNIGTQANPLQISSNGIASQLAIDTMNLGDAYVKNVKASASTIDLVTSRANNFTLDTGIAKLRIAADITFTNDVNLISDDVQVLSHLTSTDGSIYIRSSGTNSLRLEGVNGQFTAGLGVINVSTQGASIDLLGNITFNTTASLTAPESISIAPLAVITAVQNSYLITANLDNQGSLVTLGTTWFIVNPGTLANGGGNVNLTSDQDFAGGNFAILASGDINLNGITINLSSSTGGGSLTMVAGYNFDYDTDGNQIIVNGVTIGGFTAAGGERSITGNATIITSGDSGNAGGVTAVATGSINLGSITADSTSADAGKIVLLAGTDITTGAVSAVGASGGSVFMATGEVDLTSLQVLNGQIIAGAPTNVSSSSNGTISVNGAINTGGGAGGSVSMYTGFGGTINYNASALVSHQIQVGTGTLNFSQLSLLAPIRGASGQGGNVGLTFNNFIGASPTFTFDVTGDHNNGGEVILVSNSAAQMTLGTAGQFAFILGGGETTGGGVAQVSTAGDLIVGAGTVTGTPNGRSSAFIATADGNLVVQPGALALQGLFGDGAVISLVADGDQNGIGNLTLNETAFLDQANAVGSGNGGFIRLIGQNIVIPGNSATNALNLSARGADLGNGGEIIFGVNSATNVVVGPLTGKAPKGTPPLYITANASSAGASGDGGAVTVATGGNLTVTMGANGMIAAAGTSGGPWDGASYQLAAGGALAKGGTLKITGDMNANGVNGGDGGVIRIQAKSGTAFGINPSKAPSNGISGNISANGTNGLVEITNSMGGISVGRPNALSGANVSLIAGGSKGTITAASGATISASDTLALTSLSGAIGGKTALSVDTPNLTVNTGGTVGINNLYNGGDFTLQNSFGGAGFSLRTATSTFLNSIGTTKGSITIIESAGNLTVVDGANLTANSGLLTLQNTNVLDGTIAIGEDTFVQTVGSKGGNVNIVIGTSIPRAGTFPFPTNAAPDGVSASNTPKNVIYFDTPGVVVSENAGGAVEDNAEVVAKNKNVLFDGTTAGSIVLGKNSYIMADPPDSANRVSAAAIQAAASSQVVLAKGSSDTLLFGFVGENSTVTSDFSVLSLTAGPQVQNPNNAGLMTSTNLTPNSQASILNSVQTSVFNLIGPSNASLASQQGGTYGYLRGMGSTSQIAEEDNSYVVGYFPSSSVASGSICSDSEAISGQVAKVAGVETLQHSDTVKINEGTVLFIPFKDTTVVTPNGTIHIAAKAIALVSTSKAGLAVYDIEDQHKGSVSVESNGHNVVLSPGRHVMVTPHHGAEFAQVNPIESIAHRTLQSTMMNGHRAHTSEFSVISAMDSVKPLQALATSKHAHARQISDRLMKTTAIMLHLSGAKTAQYQHYFKPRMTAKM